MKKQLILVRHSLPLIDKSIPAREWHLSADGHTRARELAVRLLQYKPDGLCTSVEPKAMETAEIIGDVCGLSVRVVDNLHEHERYNVPFQSQDEFQSAVCRFFSQPQQLVFGNETAQAVYHRFATAVQSLSDLYAWETGIIVSHGTVISSYVSHLTGMSAYMLWKELGVPCFLMLDLDTGKLIAQENIR